MMWTEPLRRWLSGLLDALWPRMCLACDRRMLQGEHLVCTDCLMSLPQTNTMTSPADNPLMDRVCGWGRVENAVAAYYYEQRGVVSRIIGHVKYRGWTELGVMMGRIAAEDVNAADIFRDVDIIVPVPLHRKRMKSRGYNQSEMIARGMAEVLGVPVVTNAIERVVYQDHQVHLTHLDRRENVASAFGYVNPAVLNGRHVLLVDDVITTGSTIGECINTLQTAIPTLRISVFSLAMGR